MSIRACIFILLTTTLFGCTDKEQEARTLLNQAIKEWDAGNIEAAEKNFAVIEADYINTITATEAMNERRSRKEQYKADNSLIQVKKENTGTFSRAVIKSIDRYFQKESSYPKDLTQLDISQHYRYQEPLTLCRYEKALFNYGYKLDCNNANYAFLTQGKSKRTSSPAAPRTPTAKTEAPTKKNATNLAAYPRANSTWGQVLNSTGKVPQNSFKAFYINTNHPENVIATETVDKVRMNYIHDKFHAIPSEDFGAYWLGSIFLTKQQTKKISISQSWAKTRLIIDGHIVYDGGSNKELLLTLNPGHHTIEVEYINNWHTTEFSLTFLDQEEKLSNNEIKNILRQNINDEYDALYAGVYESSNKDLSLVLNISKNNKPIVLFLSSYSSIDWYISNPFNVDIKAIIYSSHSPGTSLSGEISRHTLQLPSIKRIGSYTASKNCQCTPGGFHCSGQDLSVTKTAIEQISAFPLYGYSGKYSAASLNTSELIINESYLKKLEEKVAANHSLKKACVRKNNPDFEGLFKSNTSS